MSSLVHHDPFAQVLIALAIILGASKLGGDIAIRLGQAAVLGELVVGVLLGNLDVVGVQQLQWIANEPAIDMLARLGVLLLLFEVGLEATLGQMLEVGASSLLVAVLGVITPFALGWGVGALLMPQASSYAHAFLGATLTATSVGITARVFKDLNQTQSHESRIILGAAVIDDALGLVILAVITAVISAANAGKSLSYANVFVTLGASLGFLFGAAAIGAWLSPRMFRIAFRLRSEGVLLGIGLAFCFLMSWAASAFGLASIVGAFAAGLVLESVHYRSFKDRGEHELEDLIKPITSFLVPVFFVVMGMRTDIRAFAAPGTFLLASGLTLAAVLGKQICGWGVLGRGVDRITVGIGMIPRGEVGLIFANMGLSLTIAGKPILRTEEFSALVVVVIVTTLVTPPLLKWSLNRNRQATET